MWEKLSKKWGVSRKRAILIFCIFGLTGTTLMIIKVPFLNLLSGGDPGVALYFLYYIIIFPVFNLILLIYGFVFGQFEFFWNYEKQMFIKLGNWFYRLFSRHDIKA